MKIGIIGLGMVGNAVYQGLMSIGNDVSFYDPKYSESKFEDILDTECVFVCVPTNPRDDGTCDTSIVEKTIKKLDSNGYSGVIVIKSTVTPGTTDEIYNKFCSRIEGFRLAFVPEFLRERCALTDFLDNHDVCIIGCYKDEDYEVVKKAHGSIPKNFAKMSPLEAELSKYFNNVFNALRIVFANGFYEICQNLGADYQKIYDAMILRNNINPAYLRCSEKLRGPSGYCLSKDPLAFMHFVENLKLNPTPTIFKAIVEDSRIYPKTVLPGMRTEKECFGKEL